MEEEAKQVCPYCGSEDYIRRWFGDEYWYRCKNCERLYT